jgi:hypothetical protein
MSIVKIDPLVTASLYGESAVPIAMVMEEEAEAMNRISIAKEIFMKHESDNFAEAFTGIDGIGDFENVGEAGAYPETGFSEGDKKVLTPYEWKQSIVMTQTMVEDNKLLDMKNMGRGLVTASKRTREKFFAALLGGAYKGNKVDFAGKKYDVTSKDGVSMFNTKHPTNLKGEFQSNMFSNALDEDGLGLIETAMENFCDKDGNLLDISPDTIIIPNIHALKKSAFAAVASEQSPNSSDNAMSYQFGKWKILVWSYLNKFITSEDNKAPFIIMDSNYNKNAAGAIDLERVALTIKSGIDPKNDNNVWRGRERYSGGFVDWKAFAIGGIKDGTALV